MRSSAVLEIPARHSASREERLFAFPLADGPASSCAEQSRHIYGNFDNDGFAIDWHDEEPVSSGLLPLQQSSPHDGLELCLNLTGSGMLCGENRSVNFGPGTAFVYAVQEHRPHVRRNAEERHRFLAVRFCPRFLQEHLSEWKDASYTLTQQPLNASLLEGIGEPVPLMAGHEQLISQLLRPQCMKGPCQLRCRGIVLQLMADFLFVQCCGNDSGCDRQKCLARERVRGVMAILQRDLIEPPALEAIGREIGCSPFHLSRTFSKETGMTIPQYLRALRMRHAAELLKGGRCNVTEAAMAVGYSSLSHFSQAFCQETGCCPAAYSFHSAEHAAQKTPVTGKRDTPRKGTRAPIPAA